MSDLNSKINNFVTERRNSFGFWFAYFLIFVAADQISKFVVQHSGGNIFRNYNFAFSLPIPSWIMFVIYAVVFLIIIRHLWRTWEKSSDRIRIAWLLILAGGFSNIIERIILGYVRDFIPIASGTLNLADFMIILGAILILTKSIRE